MKITTLVSIPDQEIKINVSMEDIVNAIQEDAESKEHALQGINNFAQFIKAIPDDMIEQMNTSQRKLISDFFQEQSHRFAYWPCT